MRSKKKLVYGLAWAASAVFALMLIISVLASWYINSGQSQKKIRAMVKRELGDTIQFQRVGLDLFLRPHFVFHQVTVNIPDMAVGSIETASVYPRLWSLLTGTFRIAKIRAISPNVTLNMRHTPQHVPEDQKQLSLEEVKTDIAATLSVMRAISPDLVIEVKDGRLRLKNDHTTYTAQNIRGRLLLIPNGFDLTVQGDADKLGPSAVHGRFIVNGDHIGASEAEIAILDTSLVSSVDLISKAGMVRSINLSLDGTIGRKTVKLLSNILAMPPEQTVRAPLSLSNTRLTWKSESGLTLAGMVAISNGPSISFQVYRKREELFIPRLVIQDEESMAFLTIRQARNAVDIVFKGSVNERTLNRMFERSSFQRGWVRGDLRAHIQLDRPSASSWQGTLEASNILFSFGMKKPVKVEHVVLHADRNTLTLREGVFFWGDSRVDLHGTVDALKEGFRFDMDLTADRIQVEDILESLTSGANTVSGENHILYPALLGIIRVNSKTASWGRFTSTPMRADIKPDQQGVRVVFIDAAVCKISIPGNFTISDNGVQLDLRPGSAQQSLESALACLQGLDKTRITGTFDLRSHLSTRPTGDVFARRLHGYAALTARDGEIFQYPLLSRIFAAINVTDLIQGKLPDLVRTGFAYTSITIKGMIQDGKFIIREAAIDGATANIAAQGEVDFSDNKINITVLVAPFKTVDVIVRNIPLVSNVLGNTLITIPVKVTGKLDDPSVTILSPTAIGEGLLGIMKRTLQLPFTVIQPMLPNKEKHEQ